MEPVEPIDYQREAALSLAVQHCQHRAGIPSGVVLEVAEFFLEWLKGGK